MNYIFQISKDPIEKDKFVDISRYYGSGFIGYIEENHGDENRRDDTIELLELLLPRTSDFDGRKLTIKNKDDYFTYCYKKWKELIAEFANIDLKTFEEGLDAVTYGCWESMYEFSCVNNRNSGVYIDDIGENSFGFLTLDDFMRQSKNGDVWYIGKSYRYRRVIWQPTLK